MRQLTMVAFGDSVTNGVGRFGVTDEQTFRSLAGRQLGKALGCRVEVVNAGVDGDVTPSALARVEDDVLSHSPQLVTILFGVNDAGYYRPDTDSFAEMPRVPEAQFANCLLNAVTRIQAAAAKVVLLTPLPMNETYWGANLQPYVDHGLNFLVERYVSRLRDLARTRGVRLVDTYAHFLHLDDTTGLIPDGIHPTVEGHQLIADLLTPALVDVAQQILGN